MKLEAFKEGGVAMRFFKDMLEEGRRNLFNIDEDAALARLEQSEKEAI